MKMRTAVAAASTVALATACAGSSSGSSTQPSATSTGVTGSPSVTTPATVSPTATATATAASGSGGRLAFVSHRQMFVVRVSAAGKVVGVPGLVGPADLRSQPHWSPLGRYLVWTWNDQKSHSENPAVVELYDTSAKKLTALRNLNFADVAATGTGAQVVEQRRETSVADVLYDGQGHSRTAGQATFSDLLSVIPVGHRAVLVETGAYTGKKPPTLWLLPPAGKPQKISTIPTLRFLGADASPALGWTASANDGVHAAFVTALGQDGACADGQSAHLVDLDAETDVAVALPYKDSDLRTPSYSPAGVLGGILDECGSDGADTHNAFAELHGSQWTTVVPRAVLGARGPDGLLAIQVGTLPKKEYSVVVSQDHPLEVRSAGKTTATLPAASAIAWTQAAVPPQG